MLTPGLVPILNPSVVIYTNKGNVKTLINTDTSISIHVNDSGVHLWNLIDNQRSIQDIIDCFSDQFEQPPASIEQDVLDMLAMFTNNGFIGFEVEYNE